MMTTKSLEVHVYCFGASQVPFETITFDLLNYKIACKHWAGRHFTHKLTEPLCTQSFDLHFFSLFRYCRSNQVNKPTTIITCQKSIFFLELYYI